MLLDIKSHTNGLQDSFNKLYLVSASLHLETDAEKHLSCTILHSFLPL